MMIETNMNNKIIEVKNLKVRFLLPDSIVYAVRDASFDLKKNEIMGIVGESGSGKSVSCLSMLRQLPKKARTEGKIMIDGQNVLEKEEDWVRKNIRGKKISMVFQDPTMALNPIYSIGWQMKEALMFRRNKIGDAKKEKDFIINILEELKVTDPEQVINKYPHQLSGGMKQRIVVAIALLLQSDILIADEPTTSLDVTIQHEVIDLIVRLKKDHEMSVIFISHDLNLLADYCNRIVVMYGGMVLENGYTDKVYNNPKSPYTSALLKCIPPLTGDKRDFEPIPGEILSSIKVINGCPFEPRCKNRKERCRKEIPKLEKADGERYVRCFYPN
jgi:peptide/nickel transport system ATP-binding protein